MPQSYPLRRQMYGFSLVELSIVLVILGLLVGGILSGQALIRASELRSVTSEYNRYVTAVHSFRDKYFQAPGDMQDATRFWGRMNGNADCATNSAAGVNAAGACDGNGNGSIAFAGAASQAAEFAQFWRQLALAGLIEGTYSGIAGSGGTQHCVIGTDCPRSKMTNAGWGIWNATNYPGNASTILGMDYGNNFSFARGAAANIPVNPLLKPQEVWNIDSKIDDGRPAYGNVIIIYYTDCTTPNTGVASATNYDISYTLSNTANACGIFFRKVF